MFTSRSLTSLKHLLDFIERERDEPEFAHEVDVEEEDFWEELDLEGRIESNGFAHDMNLLGSFEHVCQYVPPEPLIMSDVCRAYQNREFYKALQYNRRVYAPDLKEVRQGLMLECYSQLAPTLLKRLSLLVSEDVAVQRERRDVFNRHLRANHKR